MHIHTHRISHISGWSQPHNEDKNNLKLQILLPLPPKAKNYKHILPCSILFSAGNLIQGFTLAGQTRYQLSQISDSISTIFYKYYFVL